MTIAISPTQSNIQQSLRAFLLTVLPEGVDAIVAVENVVPEPTSTSFCVISPLRFTRLRTNIDSAADVRFIGSISGTTLTVSDVSIGMVQPGAMVFGVSVAPGTTIISQTSGPTGGAGTYTVSVSQTLPRTTLSAGAKTMEQGAECVIQCDFHSTIQFDGNGTLVPTPQASDMAQTVATILRDEAGAALFEAQDPNYGVAPLFADDPKFAPFWNAEKQMEWRVVLECHLQVNQITAIPATYADSVDIGLVSIDAEFPPA